MGHPVGEFPVVGEQQQPLGILVQTAHGVDALPHVLHQLGHALAAPLVVEGGDEPPGLVQRQVDFLLAFAQGLAVQGDGVLAGDGAVPQPGHPAVDGHPPGGDELLGLAAGSHPAGR